MAEIDYVAHIRAESARFAAALRGVDPATRVPTCPEWTAADLLWHLAEVQLNWAATVRERLQTDDASAAFVPERPGSYEELFPLLERAGTELVSALESTADDVEVWTWWPSDQSVGFIRRRQAHEALIHRLDAELVTGPFSMVDPDLAADGIDQALHVDLAWRPHWADLTVGEVTGMIRTTDVERSWVVNLARWSGTSPLTGEYWADHTLTVVDDVDPSFTVSGSAADVDAWLWNRVTPDAVRVVGNHANYVTLQAALIRA